MPRQPARIQLTAEEEATLTAWTRKATMERRFVERAQIILLLHQGSTTVQIAARLHTRTARVSKWRQRFAQDRLPGLTDAPRSGKPVQYGAKVEKRILRCWTSRLGKVTRDGMARCWPQHSKMSANTRCGECCAATRSTCSDGAVGASAPIPSLLPRRPISWACT